MTKGGVAMAFKIACKGLESILSLARSIQARVAKKSELIQLFLHYTSSVGSRRETTGTVVKFLRVYVRSWLYGHLNICAVKLIFVYR
jgi:hypothetical protein